MKKLITILTALGISASAGTLVVACGKSENTTRFGTPVLDKELRDKVLFTLLQDDDITNGKIFDKISDIENVILKMVQEQSAKISNKYFKNLTNEKLNLATVEEQYEKEMEETASNIAQNQFYLEYTNSILNNPATSKDQEIAIDSLSTLNPQNLLTSVWGDEDKYYVFFSSDGQNWTRWQYLFENGAGHFNQLPGIEELQTSKFIIAKSKDNEDSFNLDLTDPDNEQVKDKLFYKNEDGTIIDGEDKIIYSQDGQSPLFMNGETALEYRFQEYFNTKVKTENIENVLTMSYLDSKIFSTGRNENSKTKQDTFLDISSNLARSTQTWDKTGGYESNLKMVWSFTFNGTKNVEKAWDLIRSRIDSDGSIMSQRDTLSSIYKLLENENNQLVNQSKLGTDPFFNFSGYNGIVKVSDDKNSVTGVDGNLLVAEDAKSAIAKASGPSVLTRTGKGKGFESANKNATQFDFIFVLPIYLIDLLNDRTNNFANGQSTVSYVDKNDLDSNNQATKLYASYGEATSNNVNAKVIDNTKKTYINQHLDQADNFQIYVNDGVPYTFNEFNNNPTFKAIVGQDVNQENIWQVVKDTPESAELTFQGIQFMTKNDLETNDKPVIGNVSIGQWVNLGQYAEPASDDNFEFKTENGNLFVKVSDKNFVGKIETKFSDFDLSFDDGTVGGMYTTNGTINDNDNQGKTYSYKVNMGATANNIESYVRDENGFDFYSDNKSSLDISNLTTNKKNSLLKELEFITTKEEGVAETAANEIYPLFLRDDQIFFQPLYDSLKKYLIDENGGSSD